MEWKGKWGDKSYDWKYVSNDVKKQLQLDDKPDGEFWMSFDDFYSNFEIVQICSLSPDAYSDELEGKHPNLNLKWNMISYNGEWKIGKTAGGCGQYDKNLYWTNPQFLITLTDVDPSDGENMATIIISLMQKYTREKRLENNGEPTEQFIQFRLYRIKNKDDALKAKNSGTRLYANQLEPAGTSGTYINLRDVTKRFRLPPGDYLVIPSCYDRNVEGEFLLRLFTEQNSGDLNSFKELNEHKENLAPNQTKFLNFDKSKEFGNWNDIINSQGTRSEWKSPLTARIIRSRRLMSPLLPYKETSKNIYEKSAAAEFKPKLISKRLL